MKIERNTGNHAELSSNAMTSVLVEHLDRLRTFASIGKKIASSLMYNVKTVSQNFLEVPKINTNATLILLSL